MPVASPPSAHPLRHRHALLRQQRQRRVDRVVDPPRLPQAASPPFSRVGSNRCRLPVPPRRCRGQSPWKSRKPLSSELPPD